MFAREFEKKFFGNKSCVSYEYRGPKNEVWAYALGEIQKYAGEEVFFKILDVFEQLDEIITFLIVRFRDGSFTKLELQLKGNTLKIKIW